MSLAQTSNVHPVPFTPSEGARALRALRAKTLRAELVADPECPLPNYVCIVPEMSRRGNLEARYWEHFSDARHWGLWPMSDGTFVAEDAMGQRAIFGTLKDAVAAVRHAAFSSKPSP